MKKFIFNKEELTFKEHKKTVSLVKIVLFVYAFLMTVAFVSSPVSKENYEVIKEIVIDTAEEDTFSKEKLIAMLEDMHLKFPHIVLAQAIVESNFKSPIFLENNNLFGMKKAYKRPNVQIGENRGHAVYESWRMSVIDYALYQCYSLKRIKAEEDYLKYLSQHYAESKNYYTEIKKVSNDQKEVFKD